MRTHETLNCKGPLFTGSLFGNIKALPLNIALSSLSPLFPCRGYLFYLKWIESQLNDLTCSNQIKKDESRQLKIGLMWEFFSVIIGKSRSNFTCSQQVEFSELIAPGTAGYKLKISSRPVVNYKVHSALFITPSQTLNSTGPSASRTVTLRNHQHCLINTTCFFTTRFNFS